ncbi:MAG: MFS transporter [Sporolactobacillus sp.]
MRSSIRKGLGLVAGTLAFVMAILDTTIVNIVLPDIMKDLNSSVSTVSWLLNGYNMAFAILLLTAARLADQFGRKRIFLMGIGLFTVASLLCGLSQNMNWLIGFRVLQGAGAAILVPVSIPLLLSLFRKEQQTLIIAIWGACSALASAFGPVLGGLLADYGSWHDVFFVNVPLGLLALVLTLVYIHESADGSAERRIDVLGMLALSAAIAPLIFYLIKGNDYGWTAPMMLLLPIISVIALLLFLLIEWKSSAPMLPFALFKNRTFRCSNYIILLVGIAINAIMFIMSLYLTQLRHLSILHAGYLLSTLPIGTMLLSIVCSRLIKKISPAILLMVGTCIIGSSSLLMSRFTANTPYSVIGWILALSGCGFGINFPVIMNLIVGGVPDGNMGMASGLGNMSRTLGSIVGVAVIVAVLTGSLQGSLAAMKQNALQKIDRNTVLLPVMKSTMKSKIRAIKANTSSAGSTSSAIPALHRRINRKIVLTRRKKDAQINRQINQLATSKWLPIQKAFQVKKQIVQRMPHSPVRTALLAQLKTKEQLAANQLGKQKTAMRRHADHTLAQKLNQQRRELLRLTDWLQERAEKNAVYTFSCAFNTTAGMTFAALLFCPFIRRHKSQTAIRSEKS